MARWSTARNRLDTFASSSGVLDSEGKMSYSRLSEVRLVRTRGLRCFRRRCGLWRPLRAGWCRRERWRDRLPSVAISQTIES